MVSVFNNKKQVWSFLISVAIAVFSVTLIASAVTYIDADSVGVATATPGAALGVKGGVLVDGFALADYFVATSSNPSWLMGGGLGLGTTAPGAILGVKGGVIVDDFMSANYLTATSTTKDSWLMGQLGLGTTTVSDTLDKGGLGINGSMIVSNFIYTSFLNATSTTATSTFDGGLEVDGDTLRINRSGNNITIATTSSPAVEGDTTPIISVGAGSASTTLFLAGGASVGSSIVLASADGSGCIIIIADKRNQDAEGTINLVGKVIACPAP